MDGYFAFPKTQDCLVSYLGHSLGGSCPSAEKQSVYSTAPADWANVQVVWLVKFYGILTIEGYLMPNLIYIYDF